MSKKRTRYYHLLLLLILPGLSLLSCNKYKDRETVRRAELLLENHPDSAADMLDSIRFPKSMGKEYYMQFLVNQTLAKYKTYRDIKNDTAVMKAVRYFERKNDNPAWTAKANYAAGGVRLEQENNESAIQHFKAAAENAELTNLHAFQGLIYTNLGYLYQEELYQEQALAYLKRAILAYQKGADTELKQLNPLTSLAANYITIQQPDSALIYLDRAQVIADSAKDEYYQAMIRNNVGIAYQLKQDYKRSNAFLSGALLYNPDSALVKKIHLNLAKNYLQLNDSKSLKIYVDKLLVGLDACSDLHYKASAYNLLAEIERERHNYLQAMEYMELYNENALSILEKNQSQALIEAEKKYNYTYHKNEAELAKARNRQLALLLLTAILVFALLFALWNQMHKRKRLQLESKNEQAEHRQRQQDLENRLLLSQIELFGYNNATLRQIVEQVNDLHHDLQVKAQAGLLHEKSERYEEIQQIIKDTKTIIRENIGKSSKRFLTRQQLLPEEVIHQLSNDDAVIIGMVYSGEDRKTLAATLSTSQQAIYNRIPRLKKRLQNYGIPEAQIAELFDKLDK